MSIIDISAERDKRNGPDAEFVRSDDYGRKMFSFSVEYKMGDDGWGFTIWAYSMEDAQARVDAIRASGVLLGQVYSEMPA